MNPPLVQESIAIVGMAGRFPEAQNLTEFWRNLREGKESVSFFSDAEAQWLPLEHPPKLTDPRYVKARAVLRNAEWFDAPFFHVNPKEAALMDPQHRVFLECSWEALENAGCNPAAFDGLIGVFAGASMNTYLFANILTNPGLIEDFGLFSTMLLNAGDFVTTRVSYKLNLRGPSINVQTACSTSLVAVCLAAQNLLQYRCDLALAGGVSITYPAHRGQQHQEGGIVSDDGHCRAFDARATGTVLGDGAGVVVLKRLSEALADGDHIYAVIKGTALNNDGALKMGYTAPSSDGQAEVIALAQSEAGVAPESVSYVEAHGTGTPLGDPIEVAGLTKAFGARRGSAAHCALGSVKTNIGHLDVAAGIAGLIKTVLALHHGEIPPSLHFQRANPKTELDHSPFFVNQRLRPWPRGSAPRRAGVSSFGIGGTNAHAVLEESPLQPVSPPARSPQVLLLSARTASALETATDNLVAFLRNNPDANLADVAFTLQTGRKVFDHRRAAVCANVADAARVLAARDPAHVSSGVCDLERQKVGFMFPGQGAQAVNMGRELYESEPLFRGQVDESCAILTPLLGLDLRSLIYPGSRAHEDATGAHSLAEAERLLNETRFTQPALFVIEHALAQLLSGWGIRPDAMIGHSLGEYVAACIAGVFSLDTALKVVVERARLMQAQPAGAMVAVRLAEERLRAELDQNLALAAVNAPGLCVVSGPFDAIENLERRLSAGAIGFKRLSTSHAFHSAMMESALAPFAEMMRKVPLRSPQMRWVSNVTGKWITPELATSPDYWVAHLRGAVRFADGLGELVKSGIGVLLEVGPGTTLTGLARRSSTSAAPVASLGRGSGNGLQGAVGELWIAGASPDWRQGVHRGARRRILPLPGHPFERQRYWVEPGTAPVSGRISGARAMPAVVRPPAASADSGIPFQTAGAENTAKRNESVSTLNTLKQILHGLSGVDLTTAPSDASFHALGFDSLFLTQASMAIAKHFATDLTLREIRDEYVTLGQLAAYLEARASRAGKKEADPTAWPAKGPAAVDLSTNQAASELRELSNGLSDAPASNEHVVVLIDGPLDVAELRRSCERLMAGQRALRIASGFEGAAQKLGPTGVLQLPVHDFSEAPESLRLARARECVGDELDRPYDPVESPLFRASVLRLERERHWLLLVANSRSGVRVADIARQLLDSSEPQVRPLRMTLSSWQEVDSAVPIDSHLRPSVALAASTS